MSSLLMLRNVVQRTTQQLSRTTFASHTLARVATPLISSSSQFPIRTFSALKDSTFLSPGNNVFVEQMYAAWSADPKSVHSSWDAYFRTGQYMAPPTLYADGSSTNVTTQSSGAPVSTEGMISLECANVLNLVRAYQVRGHMVAQIDPIGLLPPRPDHELLELKTYGFTDADLDRTVNLNGIGSEVSGFLDSSRKGVTLREIHQRLKETYCGSIGFEYMHIPSVEKCNWLRERIETREKIVPTHEEKLQTLAQITASDHFESFIDKRVGMVKRFGVEGAESFVAGMKSLLSRSADLGVENVVVGMPHRGRLNVLHNVLNKDAATIFSEFADTAEDDPENGNGDVKYHLGFSLKRDLAKGHRLNLTLLPNPSHLEAVDPVALGKTRAKQYYTGDTDLSKCMSVLIHGDAAFAGQGVVYECFGMMNLPEYKTGGTIHIVVNNQVGFTTSPNQSRSSPYCTDIAKTYNLPIFHVNGDDPEAVVYVCQLAAEWRARFKMDAVIDIVCYRRNGHNELDEPRFTQPIMYKAIDALPSTLSIYQKRLLSEGITQAEIDKISNDAINALEEAFVRSKSINKYNYSTLTGEWDGLVNSTKYSAPQVTGVALDKLRDIGIKLSTIPEHIPVVNRLKKLIYSARLKTIQDGKDIDWATGEALAFGSLLTEGIHVRLAGQDVERGTFSQRHAVIHSTKDNSLYTPLNHLSDNQAELVITNSHLSEYGALGFELGYSLQRPECLVLWEAQFGDFFNTAQVIVDQFISSGEDKWSRQTGLVMLLPHSYDGQGPEHSSGRIERFLQMSNDHPDYIFPEDKSFQIQKCNWQILNCSTPANYFHALRRQNLRNFRKPLIVFTPKHLLRLPEARSTLEDMADGTKFLPVIGETNNNIVKNGKKVKRVIFCSGKVYYDLLKSRSERKLENVALVRVEQLSPFPFREVAAQAQLYPNAEVVWGQEEPLNMGGYVYCKERIHTALKQLCNRDVYPRYVGRVPSASPAAGHHSQHVRELKVLLDTAFENL